MPKEKLKEVYSITEVELIYRNKVKANDRPLVKTSKQAFDILIRSWDRNKIELAEQFKIILVDNKETCIGISLIALGGMNGCKIDPKIIFATALKARATAIILAHNHPSGDMMASELDKNATEMLCRAGDLLDLPILDHLIISSDDYYSMADEGIMPDISLNNIRRKKYILGN